MRAVLLALAALLVSAGPAAADRFSLTYDGVGLGFVPLGGVTVDAEVTEERYDITATLQSRGLLNLFERTNLTARSTGAIDNGVVRWRSYDLDHHYSRKRRVISMSVGENGVFIRTIEPNYRLWGDPATSEEQRSRSRDPLSSMVAMSIDVGQTRRCSGAYPTFDGRFHYLLELAGGEIDDFDDAGYEGEVLKCSLAYIAVAGFERRDAGRRRIPHGEVWFALMPDTSFAPVVRIATPMSAGGATIRLDSFRRARVDVQLTSTP
ncbi:MAG TPA: DUF3108 domain-containing protein [Vitreimonas sp.]|uniref:DUF3108 domain-containing protein n=1 Tax=Vitreimonas sp. TaxID=3069702 RepID=UPI002D379624|nr:DUF3108 domain-containing protein [Vitreimonas sp.]HYD86328.1 DUF3108 domain-containing protein [Vitreimonas sp.]